MSESDIEALLIRFRGLKHLVLDECMGLLRGGQGHGDAMGQELEWWSALGRRCALAGVKKARDREKQFKSWLEAQSQGQMDDGGGGGPAAEPRRVRPGRRGLATATISLRGASALPEPAPLIPPPPSSSLKKNKKSVPVKIHIVPPLPTLLSISLYPTLKTPISAETQAEIVAEFERGWEDGVRVIWERRARMKTSFVRDPTGVGAKPRFLEFRDGGDVDEEEGFEGLGDVKIDVFSRGDVSSQGSPILCIYGGGPDLDIHPEGCGHSVAGAVWVY